jgi:glyoxylase-like metal-dependent hydrolase (beta-lactamase superfamily II)/rhodanese-related sulfurtransferase
MRFEQLHTERGCCSYFLACEASCAAAIVDPALELTERYVALATSEGMHVRYVIDTHTHADHFSATRTLATRLGATSVMHRAARAPFIDLRVDDGEILHVGDLRLRVLATPGHTSDAMCLVVNDRVLTGDTLLIGACGRTDLPTGDAGSLWNSLSTKLLALDDATLVFPGHDYKRRGHSTIGEERRSNERLRVSSREVFVAQMEALNLSLPDHLTEALRTNMTGGKTVVQLLAEAERRVAFMGLTDLRDRLAAKEADLVVLDIREKEAFDAAHVPGARHLPRGQLELRVNKELPDPTVRIVTYCQFGKISTLAAATLRDLGFARAVALDGGFEQWQADGLPVE